MRSCREADAAEAEYGLAKRLAESLERLIEHVEGDLTEDFIGNPWKYHTYRDMVVVRAWLRRRRPAGVPKSETTRMADSEYGVCPYCLSADDRLFVVGGVWEVCHVDRTRWTLNPELFPPWCWGTEGDGRANETLVHDYRWVRPTYLPTAAE
ncbi:MAG: hypothetical protein HQ582_17135 [Planctomycetes bacterium]|nr:hypothetical protein [Planctomycetota bacterium]